MQEHLNKADPDWRWEPTLMAVTDQDVRISTGPSMRLALVRLLGFRKALHVARIIRRHVIGQPLADPERRLLIKRGLAYSAAVASWLYLGWSAPLNKVQAASAESGRQGKPSNWLMDLKVRRTQELNGLGIENAKNRLWTSPDTESLADLIKREGVDFSHSDYKAAIHTLEDGNLLLAAAAAVDGYTIVHYSFVSPRANFRSGTFLFSHDETSAKLLGSAINGHPTKKLGNRNESAATSTDPCGGCVDMLYGPWAFASSQCGSYNWSCLGPCCTACLVAGSLWWACVLVLCFSCLFWCCEYYEQTCWNCAAP